MEVIYKTRFWCSCGNHNFNDTKPHRKAKGRDCGKGVIRDCPEESIIFCCDEMKEAFNERFIVFGSYEGYGADNNVNIIDCHPWPEGASFEEHTINFCPFCGDKIVTKNIGEI